MIINTKDIPTPEELGNKVLYKMCAKYISNTNKEYVISKSWLIGRSYAVSPQRRKTKKTNNKQYDFFFDKFGEIFTNSKNAKLIDSEIKYLNKKKYCGQFDKDKVIIIRVIKLIELFNNTVKDTISQIDNCESKDELNENISFSSKYLHFHCPKIIFIYDNFSKTEASKFAQSFKKVHNVDKMINSLKKEIHNDILDVYIAHYIRCYFISKLFSKKILTPRQVDTILLKQIWKQYNI